MIYLDANATTPMHGSVAQELVDALSTYGNASSRHAEGHKARSMLERARHTIAAAIGGVSADGVYFTSGATEANNTVLRSLPRNSHVVHSAIEHPSVLATCECLRQSGHIRCSVVPVACNGSLNEAELERALRPDTALVCVIPANNEIGTIQNLASVVKMVRKHSKNAMIHMDCTQCLGKMPFNVVKIGADYATFSAHKCYGPKGVGVLYVRHGARPPSPLLTGGHQEREMRAGTEPVALIWAAAVAIKRACEGAEERIKAVAMKRDYIQKRLHDSIDARSNCCTESRLSNTLSLTIPGVHAVLLVDELSEHGVCVGMGSACSKGKSSHVLRSIGMCEEEIAQTIRVSLLDSVSWIQTREACRQIEAAVAKLRDRKAT
jgi:cysteine desulfurase